MRHECRQDTMDMRGFLGRHVLSPKDSLSYAHPHTSAAPFTPTRVLSNSSLMRGFASVFARRLSSKSFISSADAMFERLEWKPTAPVGRETLWFRVCGNFFSVFPPGGFLWEDQRKGLHHNSTWMQQRSKMTTHSTSKRRSKTLLGC